MNKPLTYSNWLVTALMLVLGIRSCVMIGLRLLNRPTSGSWILVGQAVVAGIFVFTALGVFCWKSWARSLGVVICVANLLGAVLVPRRIGLPQFYTVVLILVLLLIWFYIPSVKAKFVVRNQIA